jgi:hypothetical protein
MREIMPAKHAERLFKTHVIVLSHGQPQELLDPVADKPKNVLHGSLRQAQLFQGEIHGSGDIPLRFDQRAVQVKNQ